MYVQVEKIPEITYSVEGEREGGLIKISAFLMFYYGGKGIEWTSKF